ncbi:MAG: hypothetical protein NT007_13970 [Candidatus Kapabacteria bacterium]|nr:hypothetical protein [Candidatus Kapabacteria bacterium]
MIIILSDLHFSDSTTADNISSYAWPILASQISSSIEKNSVKELRIVLLGDTIDFLRADYWFTNFLDALKGYLPWEGNLDNEFSMNGGKDQNERYYTDVLNRIIACEGGIKTFVRCMNELARKNNSNGLYTKLTYIIGNHDRAVRIYSSLQDKIKSLFQDFKEIEIIDNLKDENYSLLARHGHEWDDLNNGWEIYNYVNGNNPPIGELDTRSLNVQTFGEVSTIELMSGIVYYIKSELISKNILNENQDFLQSIKAISNIRPMMNVFKWLAWLSLNQDDTKKEIITNSLKKAMDSFVNSALIQRWIEVKTRSAFLRTLVNGVYDAIRDVSYDTIESFIDTLNDILSIFESNDDIYLKKAENEFQTEEFKDFQYIVYGHTHFSRNDVFKANANGKINMYINTGTFLPAILQARNAADFYALKHITFGLFYRTDESGSSFPSMDLWNGLRNEVK